MKRKEISHLTPGGLTNLRPESGGPKGSRLLDRREPFALVGRDFRPIALLRYGCYGGGMKTCDKCQGTMFLERAVDLNAGLVITVLACLNCGRRKAVETEPRPLIARC